MMADEWILDVLADLTEFARKGGLPALEHHLRGTADVASREIASTQGMAYLKVREGTIDAHGTHGSTAGCRQL